MKKFFTLRGELDTTTTHILQFIGVIFFFIIWYLFSFIETSIPNPIKVVLALPEMFSDPKDNLLKNLWLSILTNLLGYFEAVIVSLLLGFVIGLYPIFREMSSKIIDALRFVPLQAALLIFIAVFGIALNMKVQFLAFGIIVYLLPIVVQRIQEVPEVYVQTLYTIGSTQWQKIRHVFIPGVLIKITNDILILVAISWTYIIVAEMVNNTGGVGSLIWVYNRQSRLDKVFAIILIIMLFGFLQDKLARFLDKKIMPFKKEKKLD